MRDVANTAVKWLLFFLIGVSVLIFSFKVLADESCLSSAGYLEEIQGWIEKNEPEYEIAVYRVKGNEFYPYIFVGIRSDSPTAFLNKVDKDDCVYNPYGHPKDDKRMLAALAKGELVISWIPAY